MNTMALRLVAPTSRHLGLRTQLQTGRTAAARPFVNPAGGRAYNAQAGKGASFLDAEHPTRHADNRDRPVPGASAPARPRSRVRTLIKYTIFGIAFTGVGFALAIVQVFPAVKELTRLRSDEESLRAYTPQDDEAAAVEEVVNNCSLAKELRQRPEMKESRPHMKFPEAFRRDNLTGGTLMGPGRLTVPPLAWNEEGGKSMVTIMHLGKGVCGHPGIVHGGLLATLLDEGLARCCFDALPTKTAVTAKLEINYLKPTPAGQYVVLRAETKRVEGRKAWVEGQIETLVADGETPVVLAKASGLFISPRSGVAAVCSEPPSLYLVQRKNRK